MRVAMGALRLFAFALITLIPHQVLGQVPAPAVRDASPADSVDRTPVVVPTESSLQNVVPASPIERRLDKPSSPNDVFRSNALYRLNFRLSVTAQEQERAHLYALTLYDGGEGRHRAITKVPLRQGTNSTAYVDTGVKSDVEIELVEDRIRLEVLIQFTEVASQPAGSSEPPLIHDWQSEVELFIELNKQTHLSSYVSAQGDRSYTLDVMVERLQ